MKEALRAMLNQAFERCIESGEFNRIPLPDYVIEVPGNSHYGHFATNLPFLMASSLRRRPGDLASVILKNLGGLEDMFEKVEVAGPGFINFTIRGSEWHRLLGRIVAEGKDYGRSLAGAGRRILVEFVSANPTGPLHLGHGRGAALGDTLCRILSFTGHEVVREFYINDAGVQVRLLGESIYSRWRQRGDRDYPFPENGYHGDYVTDLAEQIADQLSLETMEPDEAVRRCALLGREKMLEEIKRDMGSFRVAFDVWASESDLYACGLIEKILESLRAKGQIYEEEGATWIRSSLYGDDKDRVIKKTDGEYTYFASDIAYHFEKFKRGFSKAVNIWGADHHGYIQRIKAALKTDGIDENWLEVLLIQLVRLFKGGEEVKMSKRAGLYVTLKELVEEVGVDAARFVFLSKNHDSPLDFDVDLVKRQDSDNPVYYVQYAHARICSVFRKAASEGLSAPPNPAELLERLVLEEELTLIRFMSQFPELLVDISKAMEPHRLTYYLTELASLFHKYFNQGTKDPEKRIVGGEKTLSQARLCLAQGVRQVLFTGLDLLGIQAPEKM
ncbi:MAG: arginine--tRNA ligase [Deltaproteobacteria bacterium]|nr:arginine--tRNA ligase [Deltaproteobacteria bacterium]